MFTHTNGFKIIDVGIAKLTYPGKVKVSLLIN